MTQTVKSLSAVRETQVQPLDGEDPLAKEMATHSSILAWKIPWTVVHGVAKSQIPVVHRVARSQTRLSEQLHFFTLLHASTC